MGVCTFFGHRECPEEIKTVLRSTVEDLIVNRGVDVFYVGNQGMFDGMARSVLREMEQKYPHICDGVVLAYPPLDRAGRRHRHWFRRADGGATFGVPALIVSPAPMHRIPGC